MDSIDLLPLKPQVFSEWYSWSDRCNIPESQRNTSGVYLIARFSDSPPAGQADPLCSDILVIGETCRHLTDRLRDFNNAAFHDKGKHSCGARYRKMQYPNALKTLYVAILPQSPLDWNIWISISDEELAQQLSKSSQGVVSVEDVKRFKKWFEQEASAREKGITNGAWIRFLERKLIMDYAILHHRLPECNAE